MATAKKLATMALSGLLLLPVPVDARDIMPAPVAARDIIPASLAARYSISAPVAAEDRIAIKCIPRCVRSCWSCPIAAL